MARDDTETKARQLADQLALWYTRNGYEELWWKAQEGLRTTSRIDFFYRKVWGLKSEIQCLN
jgi:hypothetical protein